MALHVLLSFDDDADAVKYINDTLTGVVRVEGIYKKPTQFCDNMDTNTHGNRRVQGFTKGQKWGWWVCAQCKKPKKLYWDNIANDPGLGYNLLDRLFPKENTEL